MLAKIKGALKSKTVLFGLLLSVLGVVQSNVELLQPLFGPKAYGLFTIGVGLLVAVLRFVTVNALDEK